MIKIRQKDTTSYPINFIMVDALDHTTGKTGLTPTVTISKNGAAFGAASGAVSEISSGWYSLAGNATDRNTLGELLVHATAAGADPVDLAYAIVEYDPFGFVGDIVGADSDTLETLSDQLDTINGVVDDILTDTGTTLPAAIANCTTLGAGSTEWTYNLVDESSVPIPDADIWVTTDAGGATVIAAGRTDNFGNVTFYLDPGTYYIWGQKAGFNFSNPDTEVVA